MSDFEELAAPRLLELLTIRDSEVAAAHRRIEDLEREISFGVDWMRQRRLQTDEHPDLPTPRIQMGIVVNERYYQESVVYLVLRERDGNLAYVPLSYSKSSGGSLLDVGDLPSTGELTERQVNDFPRVLNTACFHMENTGLPGYVVAAKDKLYRVSSLRPLRMHAVEPSA